MPPDQSVVLVLSPNHAHTLLGDFRREFVLASTVPPMGTEEISKTFTMIYFKNRTFVRMRTAFYSVFLFFCRSNVHILLYVITVCFSSSPIISDAVKPWRSVNFNVLSLHKSCFLRHKAVGGGFWVLTALRTNKGGGFDWLGFMAVAALLPRWPHSALLWEG